MMKLLAAIMFSTLVTTHLFGQELNPSKEAKKAVAEATAKAERDKAIDQEKVAAQRKQEAARDAALDKLVKNTPERPSRKVPGKPSKPETPASPKKVNSFNRLIFPQANPSLKVFTQSRAIE
jgi:hypothetical protein